MTTITTYAPNLYSGQLEHYRSGKAGRLRNDGDTRDIDGLAVDVTGSTAKLSVAATFTPAAGVQVVRREGPPSLLAPSTLGAAIRLQGLPQFSMEEREAAKARDATAYVTSVGEVTEMYFTPAGAEPQSVEGLGFIPGDVLHGGGKYAYVQSQVERARRLAGIEAKLAAEYGSDVKLAYDPLGQDYVMLRPGQFGYDRVTSAREVYDRVLQDIPKMG